MSVPDGQIAGIANSNGLAVATRKISDFEACGVDLVSPFLSEPRGR
jgi:predicted nucleic acid-binding protein